MTHPAVRYDPHEAERRELISIANDLTALHGAMDPHRTPEAVLDRLHDAHSAVLAALRIHDQAHRT